LDNIIEFLNSSSIIAITTIITLISAFVGTIFFIFSPKRRKMFIKLVSILFFLLEYIYTYLQLIDIIEINKYFPREYVVFCNFVFLFALLITFVNYFSIFKNFLLKYLKIYLNNL
jgi:hypothetical protein